jgi:hypothetical protein
MDLTWLTIIASLFMGTGGVLIFVFAVKRNYFRNLEDAKYQMFWSDVEELVESGRQHRDKKEDGDDGAEKA